MPYIFVFAFVIILPALIANKIGGKENGAYLSKVTLVSTIIFLILLGIINDYMAFASFGTKDDSGYYSYAISGDVIMEQMGFSILLRSLQPLTGDSLFALKSINIVILLFIAFTWYKIGIIVRDTYLAKYFFNGILLATPLYYYYFFLLKDMIIVLLFSMFILNVLIYALYGKRLSQLFLLTIGMMAFRISLVPINIILLIAFVITLGISRLLSRNFLAFLGGIIIVFLIFYFASQREIVNSLMVSPERALTKDFAQTTYSQYSQLEGRATPIKTSFLYFLIETTGLNKMFKGWTYDENTIRGMTVLPWIFIGLPLFIIGFFNTIKKRKELIPDEYRKILCLIIVAVIFYFLSLIVNDTARWRMPGFPAMITIAIIGYDKMKGKTNDLIINIMAINVIVMVIYFIFIK